MIRKLTFIVKKFNKKDGGEFFKATIKGQYVPLLEAEENEYYTLRLHTLAKEGKKSESVSCPSHEGVYELAYESRKDIWIDSREDMKDKHILHVRTNKVMFVEPLLKK